MPASPSLAVLMESSRLPTIPAVAVEIVSLVQRPDLSMDTLADAIVRDPALAARVLKTANSGFYGRPRSVTKVRDAVVVLGLRSVKTLALGFSLVGDLRRQTPGGVDHTYVWQRSLLTAAAARAIGMRTGSGADEAFLGGLLHLIGVIALDQGMEGHPRLSQLADGDLPRLRSLERANYGFDHAEAGSALAQQWNLPEVLVTAIRLFPRPDDAPQPFRHVVRCVATAEAAADIALGPDPAGALARFRWDCKQLFGINETEADGLIAMFLQEAEVLAAMLDVPASGMSSTEVLARAHEALLQITLETERENAFLHAEREKLAAEASTDALTGLANRRHLEEYLAEHFRISTRYGTPLSLMLVDIDRFKLVNDEHGHPCGDQVLREVAAQLQRTMREADLCARYGGEEFVAVLPATPIEGAMDSAERVRAAIEAATVVAFGHTLRVTVSVGVSSYRSGEQAGPEWLIKEADMALYEAKRSGRNVVRPYGALDVSPWSLAS